MKLVEGERYRVITVKTKSELVIAIGTRENYFGTGDLVELDNGVMATVIYEDDYVDADDVLKIEEVYGSDIRKVIALYRKSVCKWEEE